MKGEEKMKKSNLYEGLVYLSIGIACLVIGLNFGTRLESLLWFRRGRNLQWSSYLMEILLLDQTGKQRQISRKN
jgi:hypothetical protein